jgi:hypothetical protein
MSFVVYRDVGPQRHPLRTSHPTANSAARVAPAEARLCGVTAMPRSIGASGDDARCAISDR